MAGHSKWANIKHRKAAQDAKRGKAFSTLIKKVSSAARRGGGDPDTNVELRLWLLKARDANVPKDNIDRAIAKSTGQLEGVTFTDFSYEGYGPGGVAILVAGATDNKNRTVAELRHAFSKHDGNLGENGCVAWMFQDKGIISIEQSRVADNDALMDLALENGAEDFEAEDGVVTLTTAPEDFMGLRDALVAAGHDEFMTDEVTKEAETQMAPDLRDARKIMKLIDFLEDYDDIESVYHNLELTDEVAEALEEDD